MNGADALDLLGRLFWLLVAAGALALMALPFLSWMNGARTRLLLRRLAEEQERQAALLGALRYQLAQLEQTVAALGRSHDQETDPVLERTVHSAVENALDQALGPALERAAAQAATKAADEAARKAPRPAALRAFPPAMPADAPGEEDEDHLTDHLQERQPGAPGKETAAKDGGRDERAFLLEEE
jgi:hypothetical protein